MFFTQINQMMNQGIDITLVIRKKEGQLMVSTLPKSNGLKDEAQNHIVPLTLTGTPEELDAGFFPSICQPIQKATGLLSNMTQFEQQADKAVANTKAIKEQKDKEAKEAKEKKEKFDKLMKKASDLEAEQKFSEALINVKQARAFATPQAVKSVDEKISALRMKIGQGSLFVSESEVQQDTPQQPESVQPISQSPPVSSIQQNGIQQRPVPQQIQQPTYQQPVNGNTNNGQQLFPQPVQQPQSNEGNNNGSNGIGFVPPVNNSPQMFAQANDQSSVSNEAIPTTQVQSQPVIEFSPDPEPPINLTADYSVHREGEYDQYPDFPGYPANNNMYNHQNI